LLIALSITGAILLGFLSWRFDKALIVYLTAFMGSYSFIRGISMFAGKFPNEIALYG